MPPLARRFIRRVYPPKPPIPPSLTASYNPFMQNKPNFQNAKTGLTHYPQKDYENVHLSRPRKNKPNFPIEDRSLSRLVGAALLFRAFSFSCFEFVSDLDIRILCFNPTIMQNKPNFQKPEMNLTPYCKRAYGDFRVCSPRKNKPKRPQFRTHCFLRITVQAFSHGTNSAPLFPIGAHKAEPISLKPLKSCRKSHPCLTFSHFFSHFRRFSRVSNTFHPQSARLCAPFYPQNRIPSPKINPNAKNHPPNTA